MKISRTPSLLAGLLLVTQLAWPGPAAAVEPDEIMNDPVMERRARDISRELRCVVCQNQSIDESDADLAKDMRIVVRDRLRSGDSDQEVIEFMVDRYGDFVLLKPPVKGVTYALWFGPVVILALGALVVLSYLRNPRANGGADGRSNRPGRAAALSDEERKRLEELLARDADS